MIPVLEGDFTALRMALWTYSISDLSISVPPILVAEERPPRAIHFSG